MKTRKSLLYLVLLTAIGCTTHRESDVVKTSDSLLWADPDSCLVYLENAPKAYSEAEEKHRELIRQHAYFRITGELENDSTLSDLVSYLTQGGDYEAAGEANYIIGGSHVQKGEYFEATSYLKEAETLYQLSGQSSHKLLGLLYFNLSIAAEQCRLFDVAAEYCQQAIPYLKTHGYMTHLSVCYHLLGKCQDKQDSVVIYLDSALYFAKELDYKGCYMEIELTKSEIVDSSIYNVDRLSKSIYLCDSCQSYSYASEIASYYIKKNNYVKAHEYLEKLALDTTINIWSKEQYYVLQSELHWAQGKHEEAYNTLKQLHEWQTREIENSAYASTYIISQRYDAAKEKELRLQEKVKKQRAYIWIVVVLLICIIVGGYSFYINKKRKLELQLSAEQKKRLEEELSKNRAILRARISERLEIAKRLYQWSSHHAETVPDILGSLSPKQAASDQQHWKEFYGEFNQCYDNLLSRLGEDYPALTSSDLQYIALTFLDFDITDISFLLNITNRTIWNRRNSIKQRMGLDEEVNLDEWIKDDMCQAYGMKELEKENR